MSFAILPLGVDDLSAFKNAVKRVSKRDICFYLYLISPYLQLVGTLLLADLECGLKGEEEEREERGI